MVFEGSIHVVAVVAAGPGLPSIGLAHAVLLTLVHLDAGRTRPHRVLELGIRAMP